MRSVRLVMLVLLICHSLQNVLFFGVPAQVEILGYVQISAQLGDD